METHARGVTSGDQYRLSAGQRVSELALTRPARSVVGRFAAHAAQRPHYAPAVRMTKDDAPARTDIGVAVWAVCNPLAELHDPV